MVAMIINVISTQKITLYHSQ